jgi:C4-dicarboxylate transporter DctM subunit
LDQSPKSRDPATSSASPISLLRVADDLLFGGEQAIMSIFLVSMTATVFIDVVHRRVIAPDSRIGRLMASIAGYAPDSPERAWIDANLAPTVGSVVGMLLLWAAFASAERTSGKRVLPTPASAALLALGSAAVLSAFAWALVTFESRDVYLGLYAIAVGLYVGHLRKWRRPGWQLRVAVVMLVLTPAFGYVAFHYFPHAYTWAKELAMLMVLWVGFFGASVCAHEGKHIRLEALERTYPPRAQRLLRFGSGIAAALLCMFFAYLGYRYVFAPGTGTYSLDMQLQETGIPDWMMTVSIPFAFSLTAARFLAAGISSLRGGRYGIPAQADEMQEAEKLAAAARRAEEAARDPEAAAATAQPSEPPTALRPRSAIFYVVLGAAVIAPFVLGKAGILISTVLLGALFALPVFVILGTVTILCFALWSGDVRAPEDYSILIERIRMIADNKALLSVPFYVMSGAVMGYGQIGRRLVDFSNAIFGWLPGGLAISVVFGCILFSAISGSSPATVIAIGSVMAPALIANGYRKDFSLGLVTAAGSLGILIPPSIPMIVYCIVNTRSAISVEEFHAAGFAPGFVIGGVLAGYCVYRGIKDKTPRQRFTFSNLWIATRDGIWSLLFPVLILGGIYLGFFDDIEAACTSVVYAIVVEVYVHRAFKLGDLPRVFTEVGVLLGSFLVVMVVAMSFAEFLESESVPQRAAEYLRALDLDAWTFLLAVNVLLLIAGCLMDIMSAIFIFVPLLAPMADALGIDPIHLGIMFIVNLEIGYLTPPVGLNLYVSATLFRQPITVIMRAVVPFIAVMIVGLLLITYIPALTIEPARWVMSLARDYRRTAREPGDEVLPTGEDGLRGGEVGEERPQLMTLEQIMQMADDQAAADADAGIEAPVE